MPYINYTSIGCSYDFWNRADILLFLFFEHLELNDMQRFRKCEIILGAMLHSLQQKKQTRYWKFQFRCHFLDIFCYTTNHPPRKKTVDPPKGLDPRTFAVEGGLNSNRTINGTSIEPRDNTKHGIPFWELTYSQWMDDFPAFPFGGICDVFSFPGGVARNPTTVCLEDWSAGWMILGKPNLMLCSYDYISYHYNVWFHLSGTL